MGNRRMQRRIGEEISVPGLAAAVNLSRSRFAHLFKVMAAVGFNDPSHFSRDFDRAFGPSPRAWRKRTADMASVNGHLRPSADTLHSASMIETASPESDDVSRVKPTYWRSSHVAFEEIDR
jgi:AraC-like DNA-binding protein